MPVGMICIARRSSYTRLAGCLLLAAAACNRPNPQDQIGTAVAGTVQAIQLSTPSAAAPSQTPSLPSSTTTAAATTTATQSPTPARSFISVSQNTNCRSGPAVSFDFRGALLVGQIAEVVARSTVPNYWYISNPDRPGEICWLWGEYATVQGEASSLPAFTPQPSPTPSIDFHLLLHSFQPCGSDTHIVFTIQNTGGSMFQTGHIYVQNLSTSGDVYGPLLDRHPFAPGATECPPGHGNRLDPGTTAYIIAPISSVPSGDSGRGTIKLCTADYLGGDCITKTIDFKFP